MSNQKIFGVVTEAPTVIRNARTVDIEVEGTHSYQIQLHGSSTRIVAHNTLSLVGGTTPGCHPGIFQYYIRRIRMSSDTPLVDICRRHGYVVENQINFDGSIDHSTQIPCFPSKFPKGTILAKNFGAIEQMNIVRRLQGEWSDNSVSCTVYYKPEELPDIKEYLKKHYKNGIKTISFMLHQNHGFKQAPYEEITKEEYEKMVSNVREITNATIKFSKRDDDLASEPICTGGACPVK
jgi:ribonucleoside-triphosphate reductase